MLSIPVAKTFQKIKAKAWATIALLSCLLAVTTVASVRAAEVSGVTLPNMISVGADQLTLNGIGLLKKFFFVKVYVVGLYLKNPTTSAQDAISADETKRMVIHMKHDVSREEFVHAVDENVARNSGPDMPALRARLDRLEFALPALKKGDDLSFTYLPGSGTTMRCQGRELKIEGKDFAAALFSIWLGPEPVNANLKRELLGRTGD